MGMLRPGDAITIELAPNHSVLGSVGAELGAGGQGSVYDVNVSATGLRDVVVKWYNDYYAQHFRAEQLQAIRDLVEVGSPSRGYLWPRAIVFAPGNESFGYLMDRRPTGFTQVSGVVDGSVADVSYDALISFALQVTAALQELHTRGFAYRDVNLANFFIQPATGEALICDTDNIGYERRSYMGVLGKDDFMAPEIVRRVAGPSSNTDRHSLAVLLFMLFMRWHPLEGQATEGFLDDAARLRHFGSHPLFCLHPTDSSNRPATDGAHAEHYWQWYPTRLRDLFVRAFTVGLGDPQHGRVMESEWLEALVGLRDCAITCAACDGLNFHDPTRERRCHRPGCSASYPEPMSLDAQLGAGRIRRLVIAPERRVFGYHVQHGYAGLHTVGRIVPHPQDPERLGLLNTSTDDTWEVRLPDGGRGVVAPREGVPLEPGLIVRANGARLSVGSVSESGL